MKSIKILIAFLISSFSFSQVNEGFEGSWPPSGWDIYNVSGPLQQWGQGLVSTGQLAHGGSGTAYINREQMPDGTFSEDLLVTKSFLLPANPEIRFWSRLTIGGNQGNIYKVMILPPTGNPANASDYELVEDWTESEISPSNLEWREIVLKNIILDNYIGQNIRVAFVMLGDFGDRWLIDDVSIGQQCPNPSSLTTTNVTDNSANLSWNSSSATQWEIEVVEVGSIPTGSGIIVNQNSLNTLGTISLDQDTAYKYYVRSVCGTGTTTPQSEWSVSSIFQTLKTGSSCTVPVVVPSLPYINTIGNFVGQSDYSGNPGTNCGPGSANFLNGKYTVYSYTAIASGNINISVGPEKNSMGIFVYDDCADIGVNCLAGTAGFLPLTKTLNLNVVNGETYYIVLATPYIDNPYSITISQNCNSTIASTFSTDADCINGTSFNAIANITNMGGATSLTIVPINEQGLEEGDPQLITSTGTVQFGPFSESDKIRLLVSNSQNGNCFVLSEILGYNNCSPENDNCIGAIALTPNIPTEITSTPGTLTGATASNVQSDCVGSDDDVWFSFVATNTRHWIDIHNIYGTQLDLNHGVYVGDCNNLTQLYCSNINSSEATNLVIGQTYFIRVFSASNIPANTTFTIQTTAFEPNCTDDNPQSATVLELFKNLLNHLLLLPSVPQGYTCPELAALTPYLTDSNPGLGIYNFTSAGYVSFSFKDHGVENPDVFLGPVNPLIAEIYLLSYISPEDSAVVTLKLVNDEYLGGLAKRYQVKHINFCPSVPCQIVEGTLSQLPGLSCAAPNSEIVFTYQTQSSNLLYSWAFYSGNVLVASSNTNTTTSVQFANAGTYKLVLTLTAQDGCKTKITKYIHISTDCVSHCTETDPMADDIKNLYVNLINYLRINYPNTIISAPFNCPPLAALSQYITDANPLIHNLDTTNGLIRFSFSNHEGYDVIVPNQGIIADIDIFDFTTAENSQNYTTIYQNGTESTAHSVKHVKFCPNIPCQPLIGNIYFNTGLSCMLPGEQALFGFYSTSSTIISKNWKFFEEGMNNSNILYSFTNTNYAPISYPVAGIYKVVLEVTYGNGCTQSFTKWITVSNDCSQCTESNPQTVVVKNAYIDLINYLLNIYLNGGSVSANPFTCTELDALAPFLTESDPKIWNVSYYNNILKFSFANHGTNHDVSVIATSLLTDIDLLNYGTYTSFDSPVPITTYFADGSSSSLHTVKHIDFCPQNCTSINGSIKLLSGQNCIVGVGNFKLLTDTNLIIGYNWTFYKPNGEVYTTSADNEPHIAFNANGEYLVKLVVTTNTNCTATFFKTVTVSSQCTSCTETSETTDMITTSFRVLLNKLLGAYGAGMTINDINIQPQMSILAPYITGINPGIYNISYNNNILSFSFSPTETQPDVMIVNHGFIADLNITGYVSASQITLGYATFTNGLQDSGFLLRHLDFCPPAEVCESHVAFVIDESASISTDEATSIRAQLSAFVDQQKNSGLKVSFIGMSDGDFKQRTDHITGKITSTLGDNNSETGTITAFNNWIDGYRNGYTAADMATGTSQNSDYWLSGLTYAFNFDPKPEIIIVIADGSQTSDVNALKAKMQEINNYSDTHLYVYGIRDGYYVDGETNNAYPDDPNNPLDNPVPGVVSPLMTSLKYLLNLPSTDFPVRDQDHILSATYFDYNDFEHIGDYDLRYFSNKLAEDNIDCNGVVVPLEFCDDCHTFKPQPNEIYWLSGWVKEESNVQQKEYNNAIIKVIFEDANEQEISEEAISFEASGDIIDGWQRVEGQFTVPGNTVFISIQLINLSANIPAYFDDIRVHPINGSMKSFVYDPETFRLMAEQDENNYSTFYEYDKEGGLIRIKKETSRGIKTIQESRSGTVINLQGN